MTAQCGDIAEAPMVAQGISIMRFTCACGKVSGDVLLDDLRAGDAELARAKLRNVEAAVRSMHETAA